MYVQSEIFEKLEKYNFEKVRGLLEKGRANIESGKEGVSNLWKVIEHFLNELVERIGEKPAGLEHPQKNIQLLIKKNFISEKAGGSLTAILYKGVYGKLKDKDHKDEGLNLLDARLYYQITEDTIDYLIERILRYKVRKMASEK